MRCDSIILLGWQQSFLKAYMLKRKEPRRVAEYQAVPGTSQDLYPLVCGHTARPGPLTLSVEQTTLSTQPGLNLGHTIFWSDP